MKRSIFIMAALLATFMVGAQDFKITSEVSADTILLGSYVEVSYTIENASSDFSPPEFPGFRIVGGPNQSSEYSMINGKVTQKSSITFYLMPESTGIHTIHPATYEVDGKMYETPSLSVIVLDNPEFEGSHLPGSTPGTEPGKTDVKKPKKKFKVIKI